MSKKKPASSKKKPAPVSPFDERVNAAAKAMKVKPKDVKEKLALMGIEGDDAIEMLDDDATTEELAAPFFTTPGPMASEVGGPNKVKVKLIPFKRGWRILKGTPKDDPKDEPKSEGQQLADAIRNMNLDQWGDEELAEALNPDGDDRVIDELRRRCKDQPIVVFDDAGNVDPQATVEMLRHCRRNYSKNRNMPSTMKIPGGKLTRLYRVGDFPMLFVEECPVHGNIVLVNGYCERCQDTWKDVAIEDRVIVRVAVGVDPSLAAGANAITRLISDAQESAQPLLEIGKTGLLYNDLKDEGRLPLLRRKASTTRNGDPFGVHQRH
jgi:hypothetical protein